jgi:6,7-dimethyl-8-ribityllumazine synthase
MATNDDYETRHATWREARAALTEATAKERHSVFPEVNAARETEQQAVREEIKAAKQAEEAARAALNFPWES